MTKTTDTSPISLLACEEGFDPIEDRLRANIRRTIEAVFNEELDGFLGRLRYGRDAEAVKGYRDGRRDRQITGTFGTETTSHPGRKYGCSLNSLGYSFYHSFIAFKGGLLPKADCGSCWL